MREHDKKHSRRHTAEGKCECKDTSSKKLKHIAERLSQLRAQLECIEEHIKALDSAENGPEHEDKCKHEEGECQCKHEEGECQCEDGPKSEEKSPE